jgi:ketosteroid isomerase-like protein
MNRPKYSLTAVLMTLVVVAPAMKVASAATGSVALPACSKSGAGVAALHRDWLLLGWEKKEGDAPFDFRAKFGNYYDFTSGDVVLYDDFDPKRRVARSAAAYGEVWTQPFSQLRSARHGVIDGPEAIVGTELATSTLEFAAALEAADRSITGIRTRSTLVWRCSAMGWRIVREHNSSKLVPEQEVQLLLRTAIVSPGK